MGEGRTEPNGLIVVLYLGGWSLAVGLVTLGVGLLRTRETADRGRRRAASAL